MCRSSGQSALDLCGRNWAGSKAITLSVNLSNVESAAIHLFPIIPANWLRMALLVSLQNKKKSPECKKMWALFRSKGKYPIFTIVSCMSCLKVPHFVGAMQHSGEQRDACRDRSSAFAVLVADSLNYTRTIYNNSLGVTQNSLQPVSGY